MSGATIRSPENWRNGLPVQQAELSALDASLAEIVNGDGGGTYAFALDEPTMIAGAGLWLASSPNHQVQGTGTTVSSAADAPIVHADNDWAVIPSTHPGRNRSLLTSTERAIFRKGWQSQGGLYPLMAMGVGGEFLLPLRVHDRARFVAAVLRFRVFTDHSAPMVLPKFRVLRCDTRGRSTPMTTNSVHGFVSCTRPLSPTGWYLGGAVRTIVVACDNNTVDASAFTYFAHVFDESGTGAVPLNIFCDVVCTFDSIFDLRPQ